MDKLKLHTPDLTKANIDKLAELFPHCVVEAAGESGALERRIDFDLLRQELSNRIVEGPVERYQLNWPGKREALLAANAPIAKTLRPCREESVDFDTTRNLFIEGDNLDALKLLQETYLGKVKMIYIDPPYNTGNDFIYNDDFAESSEEYLRRSNQKDADGAALVANTEANGRFHSDWLSMMYPRLKLARNLLRDDGVIFISIDDGEIHNTRKICDDIFGNDNFIECFVWKKSYGGGPKEKYAVTQHEYMLMYARNLANLPSFVLPYDQKKIERYYKGKDNNFEVRGPYRLKPLEATKSMDDRPNLVYEVKLDDGTIIRPKRQWLWSQNRVLEAIKNNEVIIISGNDGLTLNYKQYLKDEDGEERGEKPFSVVDGIYTQHGTGDLSGLFDNKVMLQFPKPVNLIKNLIAIGSSQNDDSIILDFFSGSATTAHAAMKLNAEDGGKRQFIMVQVPETCDEKSEAFKEGYKTIADIGKERIRRAGKKLREGNVLAQNLDIGFRVLKVDSSNMLDVYYTPDKVEQGRLELSVDNIKPDRTPEDLLFHVLLDWGVDLTLPITRETLSGKTVYVVDENALAACFELGVTEELVKQIAARKPLRAVFRDAGFANDAVKVNVAQIFKLLSPTTEVKVI